MSSDLLHPPSLASWRVASILATARGLAAALARHVAAAWSRLAEDADERFLREARDLEDLEHRLRLIERGRREVLRRLPR